MQETQWSTVSSWQQLCWLKQGSCRSLAADPGLHLEWCSSDGPVSRGLFQRSSGWVSLGRAAIHIAGPTLSEDWWMPGKLPTYSRGSHACPWVTIPRPSFLRSNDNHILLGLSSRDFSELMQLVGHPHLTTKEKDAKESISCLVQHLGTMHMMHSEVLCLGSSQHWAPNHEEPLGWGTFTKPLQTLCNSWDPCLSLWPFTSLTNV